MSYSLLNIAKKAAKKGLIAEQVGGGPAAAFVWHCCCNPISPNASVMGSYFGGLGIAMTCGGQTCQVGDLIHVLLVTWYCLNGL